MSTPATSTPTTNRGDVWSEKEVKAKIAVWGETTVQNELDGAVRNKVVFQHISKKMGEQGYKRDWEQCRTKMKNLKKQYRAVKDHNSETGKGRKTFKELDNILGHIDQHRPQLLCWTLGLAAVQQQIPRILRKEKPMVS